MKTSTILFVIYFCFTLSAWTQKEIIRNPEVISGDTLKGVKLVEFGMRDRAFSENEIQVLVDFVQGGGALLTVIDESKRSKLREDGMNTLLAHFGLRYTDDTEYLHNCGALAKAGEIHAEDREVPYSGGRAIEGGNAFAWRLDEDAKLAEPFAAYVETETGDRVVALAEAMAYGGIGSGKGERLSGEDRNPRKTEYWGKDKRIFKEEIHNWLLRAGSSDKG